MSRLIQILIAVVVVIGALQWFVPRWAAGLMGRQLAHLDHGARPIVAISAVPFWRLFQGRFQDLVITADNADIKSLAVKRVHLIWINGGLALSALEHGHIRVSHPGRLTVTAEVTAAALSHFLAREGTVSHPSVAITPKGVSLKGQIQLGGTVVPLDTRGPLNESANPRSLIYHPTSIDGLNLPVLTNVQLFNLSSMKLPLQLSIERVQLENNVMALTIGN